MDTNAFLRELERALDEFRFRDLRTLIGDLDPSPFDPDQAATVLKRLRRKRRFEDLSTAFDIFVLDGGQNDPRLHLLNAHSLIDQGNIDQGLTRLLRMSKKLEDDPVLGPEVRGLMGRAYKQRFVVEGDGASLAQAIEAYDRDGREAPERHRWHGINLVACIKRARREGISFDSSIGDEDALARNMLEVIEQTPERQAWDLATALEAAIAIGDDARALELMTAYGTHPDADAFELGSTARQLDEIWQLRGENGAGGHGPGPQILQYLEGKKLAQIGGSFTPPLRPPDDMGHGHQRLDGAESDAGGWQAVLGSDAAKTLRWMERLIERCQAIGRVEEDGGVAIGTGFLAKGASFREEWGDKVVFVTNSHVVSDDDGDAIPPEDVAIEFTRLEGRPRVKPGPVLFTSRRDHLDVTILEVEPPPGGDPIPVISDFPKAREADPAPKVYVAGHPAGRELEVTLYDNDLRIVEGPFARYRCPTEGGNSGSPVLNGSWKAFALHHRADEKSQLNEGVLFDAIRKAVNQ